MITDDGCNNNNYVRAIRESRGRHRPQTRHVRRPTDVLFINIHFFAFIFRQINRRVFIMIYILWNVVRRGIPLSHEYVQYVHYTYNYIYIPIYLFCVCRTYSEYGRTRGTITRNYWDVCLRVRRRNSTLNNILFKVHGGGTR